MIIAVDFDGTCVTHEYPNVGKNIGAGPVLRELVKSGHKIILFTMRCNPEEDLKDALDWFNKENIPLFGINENPTQTWSYSPKAYAHLYIDDSSLGCPITYVNNKRFVDWFEVSEFLDHYGLFDWSDDTIKTDKWDELMNNILYDIRVSDNDDRRI